MAPAHSSSNDAGRESPVRVVRRQLITSRGPNEMPAPRVVLHLPDLDALQSVALGPVRPSTRRRIDATHAVEPTAGRASRTREAKKAGDADEPHASPLLNLLRIPINKWLPPLGSGKLSAGSVGQFVVLLQQPKVLLGAVVAVAMQLAAVLAMLGGGGNATDKSTSPATSGNGTVAHSHNPVVPAGGAAPSGTVASSGGHDHDHGRFEQHAGHRPIQTPMNVQSSNGRPFIEQMPGGQLPGGPSLLPAPQALSGVDAKDVPPWQAPVATLPAPTTNSTPPRTEAIAAPTLASPGAPVFSAPMNATSAIGNGIGTSPIGSGNIAIGRSEVSTAGPTNVVQTSGAKAKLMGTIQRKPNGGAKP